MRLLPRSLQGRLLLGVLGSVLATWLAASAIVHVQARHELDELLDGHLAQAAALLVVQQVRAGGDDDEHDHAVDAPSLHRYAPQVTFQVWHDGQLVMRSANAPVTPMVAPGEGFRTGLRTLRIGDADWRVFATHGAEHDVQVYVGERIRSRQHILAALQHSTLIALGAALPLMALGIWWAVRGGMRPLRRLGGELARRDPQDLRPVTDGDAPAEMAPMLAALNGLFGRIALLLEGERRFTADAAHELRTPIAAIRTQAQVALAEADDAQRRHALQATLDGCDRATRLVEQLLTLARLEADPGAQAAPVDLAVLLRRVAAELAPRAIDKHQSLEVLADEPAVVQGHETLLTVLLRNLLDNAVRYGPTGGTVRAALATPGGVATLVIEDSGPGLAEADRARLGERFFRVLGSGESGSGLGWSIVRRIAAVEGAAIELERSATLGGLAVRLRW